MGLSDWLWTNLQNDGLKLTENKPVCHMAQLGLRVHNIPHSVAENPKGLFKWNLCTLAIIMGMT